MPSVDDVISGGLTDVGTLADKGPITVPTYTTPKIGMPQLQTQDPYAAGTPVNQAYVKFQNQSDVAAKTVAGMAGGGVGLATKAAQEGAAARVQLNTAQAAADAKLEHDTAAIYSSLGLTPGAQSAAVLGLVGDVNTGIQDVNQRGKDILSKMDKGFLPDPIGWLVNQLELPGDIRARNVANINVLQRLQALHELSNFATEQVTAAKTLDSIDSNQRMLAENLMARSIADKSISDAQFEAGRLGIQAASVLQANNQMQLNASMKLYEIQKDNNDMSLRMNSQMIDLAKLDNDNYRTQLDNVRARIAVESNERDKRQLQIAEANMEMNRAREQNDKIRLGIQLDDLTLAKNRDRREDLIAQQQTDLNEINLGIANRRQAAVTVLQAQLDKVAEVFNMNRMTYDQYAAMADSPMKQFITSALVDPDVQDGKYGRDVIDSLDRMGALRIKPPPGVGLFVGKLIDEDNTFVSQHKFELKGLTPQEQHVERQIHMADFIKKQFDNISDTGNIFSPPPLAKMLEIPVLGNSPIAADLKTYAATNPQLSSKADDIFTFVSDGLAKGKYTPAQGAEFISNFYKSAIQQNAMLTQINRFSIGGMGLNAGFTTTVHTGTFSSEVTDVSNKANVERLLTRMSVNKAFQFDSRTLGAVP